MDFLPIFDIKKNELNEGEAFMMNCYCSKNYNQKCKNYYMNIKELGFSTCPYGFHSYVTNYSLGNHYVYTSLYIKELVIKKNKKQRLDKKCI